ncbi:MAG: hypothetical protein IE921_10475 [Rhodobacteraceae bacterium]|nr:hypothetical protein [Paracoccaceae bacterium]
MSSPSPSIATTQPRIILPATTPVANNPVSTSIETIAPTTPAPAVSTPTSADPVAATPLRSAPVGPAPERAQRVVPTSAVAAAPATTSAPISAAQTPDNLAAPLAAEPVAPTRVSDTATVERPLEATASEGQGSDMMLLAALLAGGIPLLLALGALVYWRRRSRPATVSERAAIVPLVAEPLRRDGTAEPTVTYEPMGAEVSALDQPTAPASAFVEPTSPWPTPTTANGERPAVELPLVAPSDPQAREALLRRMTEAEPDRANPFTSFKARRKRARLILQSLGRKFERRKPWIDLSQYTRNWPALRGWDPQTA